MREIYSALEDSRFFHGQKDASGEKILYAVIHIPYHTVHLLYFMFCNRVLYCLLPLHPTLISGLTLID